MNKKKDAREKENKSKNKKLIMSALALSMALGATTIGAQSIYAQGNGAGPEGSRTSLITKFAETFNISEDEITAVFEEVRQEEMVEHQAKRESELSDAVTNGELTEAQKQLILDKTEEMRTNRESNRDSASDLSREDRQAQMEESRSALESWAEENDIDMKYLASGDGHRGGHGEQKNKATQN